MTLIRTFTTLALITAAAPVGAQAPEDERWLPWVGCWEASADATPDGAALRGVFGRALCVRPAGAGVEFAMAAGETVVTRRLVADGAPRPLELGGCAGWESAAWSADQDRLFHRSELTCPGDVVRASSGVLAMLPGEVWLEAHTLEAGGERMLSVRRYHPVSPEGVDAIPLELAVAVATMRASAAGRLSQSDVVDAVRHAPVEAVQALLVERGEGFRLDAASMLRLADAGVPGEVTDLMVALSWPERFVVQAGAEVRVASREIERDSLRAPYDPWSDPWARPDPFYDPRGYGGYGGYGGYYGSDPYGYGARGLPGTWRLGGGPVVVVRERSQDRGGEMVKGKGYSAEGSSRSGFAGERSGGSSSAAPAGSRGSAGAAVGSSRGASSSGKATGRTAKPRSGSKKDKKNQ